MEEEVGEKSPRKNQEDKPEGGGGGGGGWGGWGISSFSMFSDLHKAAEEISKNAVEVVKNAAKGITELEIADSDSESADEVAKKGPEGGEVEEKEEEESEEDRLRKSALDKLEKASEDSLFGQGLKVLDSSVETFASGAWSALGGAWKGGSTLVSRLEHSAVSLADAIQHGNLPGQTPSIIETGRTFTTKGMEVLERVGKEAIELLIAETGLEVEKDPGEVDPQDDEEQFEEVTFDRCFYIYGGPDLLEELDALSSHHALLFNRKKAKLLAEQKSLYDAKLQQIQQIFSLGTDVEENEVDSDKGKNIESLGGDNDVEMIRLRDSSVRRAAEIASGFTSALGGLSANDTIQRATDRLETIHSECIHRLSELCCSAVSQLLFLGKSVISSANKGRSEEIDGDIPKIDWPEDPLSKAKIIRYKAKSMSADMETISKSFITGTSDIVEAFLATIQSVSSDKQDGVPRSVVQEKANAITDHLRADGTSAVEKIQDAVQFLAYVLLSTSMPTV
ncbi:uncharacterized protein LOC135636240 [Musa acuminata AAA Group]|uniref:uncharacterized protein LOC135636240 n=1 Tax=Musa acuminata AAA Group TaxID=214697 RepID=UPI0031E04077